MKFLRFSMISLCAAIFGMIDANAADPCKVTYECDNGVNHTDAVEQPDGPFFVKKFEEVCPDVPDGKAFDYWFLADNEDVKLDGGAEYLCDSNAEPEIMFVARWKDLTNPADPDPEDPDPDPDQGDPDPDPVNPTQTVTPEGATVACSAGTYLPVGGTSSADCSVCPYGYFCPHDGLYIADASVIQGAYACLPGAVQSLDRKSCKVSLTTNQLLYGVAGGTTKCWLLKEAANYVNCIYGGYHKPQL